MDPVTADTEEDFDVRTSTELRTSTTGDTELRRLNTSAPVKTEPARDGERERAESGSTSSSADEGGAKTVGVDVSTEAAPRSGEAPVEATTGTRSRGLKRKRQIGDVKLKREDQVKKDIDLLADAIQRQKMTVVLLRAHARLRETVNRLHLCMVTAAVHAAESKLRLEEAQFRREEAHHRQEEELLRQEEDIFRQEEFRFEELKKKATLARRKYTEVAFFLSRCRKFQIERLRSRSNSR